MIELFQFAWSPFCIVQRRILEFSGARFKITNVPNTERSYVWKLTRERYYGVPILKDGGNVVFELNEESQVIAKYLDSKLQLGLFPAELAGVQSILWRYIENEIEGPAFRLNDIHYRKNVPVSEQLAFLRHKERKFGPGCIDHWRKNQKEWLNRLTENLIPFERMVIYHPFLLGDTPRFVDFDLFGMLENFLYSGKYRLPSAHNKLKEWHRRMSGVQLSKSDREKLHS